MWVLTKLMCQWESLQLENVLLMQNWMLTIILTTLTVRYDSYLTMGISQIDNVLLMELSVMVHCK